MADHPPDVPDRADHPPDVQDLPDVPDLVNTPFENHIYLASDLSWVETTKLISELSKQPKGHQLKVYKPYGSEMKKDVERGILSSLYVVFLLTKKDSSTDNERRRFEKTAAKERYEILGKELVIVLKPTDEPIKDIGYDIFEKQYRYEEKMNLANLLRRKLCGSRLQHTPHIKKNMGASCALSFFSGWLKIILPGIFRRCLDQGFVCDGDCKETDHSQCECPCIMPAAYFLIIPYSLNGPTELKDEKITHEKKRLACTENGECVAHKRGCLLRDYSTTVHRLTTDPTNLKFYRFLAEVPNILINMYDMHKNVVGLSAFERRMAAIQFYQHLEQLIDRDPDCCGKIHFLFLDDAVDNFQMKIVERIMEHIDDLKKQERNKEIKELFISDEVQGSIPAENFQQHKEAPEPHSNQLLDYDLRTVDGKVGQGMLINLRTDMKDEISMIQGTLECLSLYDFVEAGHEGVMSNMQSFLSGGLRPDSKIFFCVLLAHGENGQLCDKKGSVLDFCDLVDRVRTALGNIPIVFIVEASQRRESLEFQNVNVDQSQSQSKDNQSQMQPIQNSLSPNVCDFLGYFSATPGSRTDGTYAHTFIGTVCKHIKEKAGSRDLEYILKVVTGELKSASVSDTANLNIQQQGSVEEERAMSVNPFVYSTLSKYVDFSQVFNDLTKT